MSDVKIQVKRDTHFNWEANNPVLASGEFGFETDSLSLKIGDGVSPWNDLHYIFVGSKDDIAALFSTEQKAKLENIKNNAEVNTIDSIPTDIPGASRIKNIVQMSQEDYDNLTEKDNSTLYLISD